MPTVSIINLIHWWFLNILTRNPTYFLISAFLSILYMVNVKFRWYLLSYRTSRNLAKLSAYDNSSFYYYVSFTSSPPSDDICYVDGGSFAIDSSLRAIKENSLKSSGDSSCILRVSSLQNVRLLRFIIREGRAIVELHFKYYNYK